MNSCKTSRRFLYCIIAISVIFHAFALGIFAGEEVEFDGWRAYRILKEQCALGYRVPGSAVSRDCADFIQNHLEELGIQVKRQSFEAYLHLTDSSITGVNLIGLYQGDKPSSDLLALSAHYDTRPIAEKDPNPAFRRKPIIGANDGASGVALLLEMARVLKERRYPGRILFLFFDVEDSGIPGNIAEWCLGSEYFASHALGEYPITAGINFDMIGDRDLMIKPEQFSCRMAPDMTESFWEFAQARAPFHFSKIPQNRQIFDDHLPFLKKGIPYINVIDFDYPWWHTQEDTPDKCSPISLRKVGNIAVKYLFFRQKNLQNNP